MKTVFLLLLSILPLVADDFLILSQPSTNLAISVSQNIWLLTQPTSSTNSNLVTKYYAGYVVHPVDGRVALNLPDNDDLFINAAASTNTLPDLVGPLLLPAEKEKMKGDIASNKGKTIKLKQYLPLSKLGNLRTRAQMQSDGWFPATTP